MKTILRTFFAVAVCFALTNAFSFIPPPPGNECKAPNGEGLGSALREMIDLIPFSKLATIYIHAVSIDSQVQAAMEYIESEDFQAILKTMHESKEFADVIEYICNQLHFNAYFYLNSLEHVLGLPVLQKPSHHRMQRSIFNIRSRSGFEGFLLDLKDALPLDKIKAVYKRRYASDQYLRLAIQKLSSQEFQKVGDRIQAMPEYRKLLQKLRSVHVDVDKILKALSGFFGWKIQNV